MKVENWLGIGLMAGCAPKNGGAKAERHIVSISSITQTNAPHREHISTQKNENPKQRKMREHRSVVFGVFIMSTFSNAYAFLSAWQTTNLQNVPSDSIGIWRMLLHCKKKALILYKYLNNRASLIETWICRMKGQLLVVLQLLSITYEGRMRNKSPRTFYRSRHIGIERIGWQGIYSKKQRFFVKDFCNL